MSAPDISLDSIDGAERIQRHHTAALVGFCASVDGRVAANQANVDLWHGVLVGGTFGRAREAVYEYYRRYDPRTIDRKPIEVGWVKRAASAARDREQNRARALNPPPPRKGRRMSRQTLEHFQRSGILLDRDPEDYEYR